MFFFAFCSSNNPCQNLIIPVGGNQCPSSDIYLTQPPADKRQYKITYNENYLHLIYTLTDVLVSYFICLVRPERGWGWPSITSPVYL